MLVDVVCVMIVVLIAHVDVVRAVDTVFVAIFCSGRCTLYSCCGVVVVLWLCCCCVGVLGVVCVGEGVVGVVCVLLLVLCSWCYVVGVM